MVLIHLYPVAASQIFQSDQHPEVFQMLSLNSYTAA